MRDGDRLNGDRESSGFDTEYESRHESAHVMLTSQSRCRMLVCCPSSSSPRRREQLPESQ
jgi:hypothetical protein